MYGGIFSRHHLSRGFCFAVLLPTSFPATIRATGITRATPCTKADFGATYEAANIASSRWAEKSVIFTPRLSDLLLNMKLQSLFIIKFATTTPMPIPAIAPHACCTFPKRLHFLDKRLFLFKI